MGYSQGFPEFEIGMTREEKMIDRLWEIIIQMIKIIEIHNKQVKLAPKITSNNTLG